MPSSEAPPGETSSVEPATPPTSLEARALAGGARACRHARAEHMGKTCTRDEQCASTAIMAACPGVPMGFTCERGHCRSRRGDGCDPPYELDADAMRRVVVDCFVR